ncbi:MAG: hypothetical protein WAU82_05835 [Candidatus Binatus sp.]|uniref:hypothetical protein n=1 Tax=Candidatus Binatus sp. TaxID=2811406 RepID=UPI003BB1EAD4
MYANWEQVRKTADAAAIAGANYLAGYAFEGTPVSGCTREPDAGTTAEGCIVKAVAANTIASSSAPALGGYQVPTLTR